MTEVDIEELHGIDCFGTYTPGHPFCLICIKQQKCKEATEQEKYV